MANPAKSINRYDSFGSVPRDANRQFLANFMNYFVTQDATGTPVTSPVTVSKDAATPLVVPAAAAQLVLSTSAALRVSEDPAGAHYFVVPANTQFTFPCLTPSADPQLANTGIIYIQGDSAQAVVQFRFDCV